MVSTNRVSDRKSCQPSSTTNVSGQSQMYSVVRTLQVRLFASHSAIEEFSALKRLTVDDFVLQVSTDYGLVWTLDLLRFPFLHLLSFCCLVKSFKQSRFFSLVHEIVLCFLRFILSTWIFHAWNLLVRLCFTVLVDDLIWTYLFWFERECDAIRPFASNRLKRSFCWFSGYSSLLVTLFMSFCEWALRSRSSVPVGGFVEVEVARKVR